MTRAHVWVTEIREPVGRSERVIERGYNYRFYYNNAGDYLQWRGVPTLRELMADVLKEVVIRSIPITPEEISREPPTEDYKPRPGERDRPITENEIRPFL